MFIAILIIGVLLKDVFLLPSLYFNNSSIDKKANTEIKALVLNAVKDRCSSLHNIDRSEIYDENNAEYIISYNDDGQIENKSIFCIINWDFMKTVEKTSDSEYNAVVAVSYPEERFYHFKIKTNGDDYIITSFLIDI